VALGAMKSRSGKIKGMSCFSFGRGGIPIFNIGLNLGADNLIGKGQKGRKKSHWGTNFATAAVVKPTQELGKGKLGGDGCMISGASPKLPLGKFWGEVKRKSEKGGGT